MNQLHTEVLTNEISLNTFKIYLEHSTINTNEYIKNITRELHGTLYNVCQGHQFFLYHIQ